MNNLLLLQAKIGQRLKICPLAAAKKAKVENLSKSWRDRNEPAYTIVRYRFL
jgi:hypothetical protein